MDNQERIVTGLIKDLKNQSNATKAAMACGYTTLEELKPFMDGVLYATRKRLEDYDDSSSTKEKE